ncbi:putative flap endonuclease-1-like 5' DNA nuclease [Mesorhizobium sp. J18]|uniref:proton-conducting membrane transporter n=1 Tax=Mesorhizobium sp. J18 TaxID=935263 RepID=UPI00119AD881|nr:proton-conducting membrane transporter [Mesorhizobium sp. J18]TWG94951.1 putative flap endonuclease-1-like 5' DNA nuclease [Mesorhizobium sp. J18]
MGTFFYILLAFIVGLLLGWFLWGRLRGELDGLRADLDSARSERDRLKADVSRLNGELEACGSARADLERQLREAKAPGGTAAKAAQAPAALMSVPATASEAPAKKKPARKTKATSSAAKPASAKADTAKAKSGKRKAANSSKKDNLRRLIGIGPVNERRLNEHGITTFAQIAAWTAADIKKVEEYLQFDGRIERERWVEQAKLLAAGDEEEFARRFPTASKSNNT